MSDSPAFQPSFVEPAHLEPLFHRDLDEELVARLQEDIGANGLMEPLLVARCEEPAGTWYVLDGLHRLEALRRLGVSEVPVLSMPERWPFALRRRLLWRRQPSEMERLWSVVLLAASILDRDPAKAHEFLLEAVHAKLRTKGLNLPEELDRTISMARELLEHTLIEGTPLHEALKLLASEDLETLHAGFRAAGFSRWLPYLHGRLRLLSLPAPFIERAAQGDVPTSRLFVLKEGLDRGAPWKAVETLLQQVDRLNEKQLAEALGLEPETEPDPRVRGVLARARRLTRLARKRITDIDDPSVINKLEHLLAEAEKLLAGTPTPKNVNREAVPNNDK